MPEWEWSEEEGMWFIRRDEPTGTSITWFTEEVRAHCYSVGYACQGCQWGADCPCRGGCC
jgi:hypothetical protein